MKADPKNERLRRFVRRYWLRAEVVDLDRTATAILGTSNGQRLAFHAAGRDLFRPFVRRLRTILAR